MDSEIIFNPVRYWFTRGGPFTKLFRTFLWSPISPAAKWSILAYICSYYAFSLAWIIAPLNFVLVGCFGEYMACHTRCETDWMLIPPAFEDTFYVSSWQVFFICLLLFPGLSNLAVCILRYRLKMPGAGHLALQQVKWIRE